MNRSVARGAAVLLVLTALLSGLAVVHGHAQPRTPPPRDIMPALLEEVRGLRAAMEEMATAGARVQLALGRLQLQEERLAKAIQRLESTRTRMAGLRRGAAEAREQLEAVEAAIRKQGTPRMADIPNPEEVLLNLRRHIERTDAELQQLVMDESVQAADVENEQARWTAINGRVEELERRLEGR